MNKWKVLCNDELRYKKDALSMVEQIAEVTNCSKAEALEKVEEARKAAVA